jgi:hypothetical protein
MPVPLVCLHGVMLMVGGNVETYMIKIKLV